MKSNKSRHFAGWIVVAVLVLASGCTGSDATFCGTVLKSGKPLANKAVTFKFDWSYASIPQPLVTRQAITDENGEACVSATFIFCSFGHTQCNENDKGYIFLNQLEASVGDKNTTGFIDSSTVREGAYFTLHGTFDIDAPLPAGTPPGEVFP